MEWNGAGAQGCPSYQMTYNNLTISNSGLKTFGNAITINGILSIEGTATGSFAGITYGTSATLQYKTTDTRTVNSTEWPATFAGTGGVIIANTAGLITLNAAKTINYSLAINSGASLNLGTFTSYANSLTLGGYLQPSGSWGGTASSATYKNSTYFGTTATGILNVNTGCTVGTWSGNTSTDWNTPSNWCGGVPIASTNVTISSSAPYQPNLGAAGGASGLCNNITLGSGASLTIAASYGLTVSGDWTNNGATFTPGTGTVTFNGTGAQAINGTAASQTFYNMTLTKTAGTTLSVSGSTTSLTVNNFTETTGNFTAPATLNINGNATLTAGTLTAGANTNAGGDWTNNGATFTHSSGTVTFNGTSAQVMEGSSSTTFNNLTINKSSGDVTLGANETVSNILTLTSGKVATTASYYLAVTNTSSSAVTGSSSSSYVNGSLRWSLATGGSYLFPVGDASNYRPFELNSITCSSPVVQVTMSSTGASTVDATMSSVDPRNWYAQLISGSFTSATVRITESGLGSANVVASSSSQSGNYTNRGGNSIGSTITSNAGISYTASTYFAVGTFLPPALTVVKSANKSSVVTGDTVTYSITITNTGSGTAINVIATDSLPPYTTYVSNSTRLNGITVAGDGSTLPLIAGLLVDDNGSRTAGAAATGILPPHSGSVGVATITFQVTVN
jgi:uncharacterized repeat protein (TIGR01451 family)